MKNYEKTARVTLYANRVVFVVMVVLLLCFPILVERYHRHFRALSHAERTAIIGGFYGCAVWVMQALWKMDKLLRNILSQKLFVEENVKCIDAVRWCCMGVSLICLLASFGFPSLLFLSVIMAFLSLVVSVVCQVMGAAVELREENDLTV
jgi:ABC-type glycerol-3-phosphate transport system permease component